MAKCGVCKTGELIPSACGCDNPKCSNHVGKWPQHEHKIKIVAKRPKEPEKK